MARAAGPFPHATSPTQQENLWLERAFYWDGRKGDGSISVGERDFQKEYASYSRMGAARKRFAKEFLGHLAYSGSVLSIVSPDIRYNTAK